MKWLVYILISGYCISCIAYKGDTAEPFVIVSWNVENLFDTLDDPRTKDEDFTPLAANKWDSERYMKKLQDLAGVLASVGDGIPPDIVGLCEVENRRVLEDLSNQVPLRSAGYEIVHAESNDPRGIDVAILARRDRFNPTYSRLIPVTYRGRNQGRTRGILYVKGIAMNKDTLHIFMNHWKSRSGEGSETEAKRLYEATLLRSMMDSLIKKDKDARIICIGDFNDEPENESIARVLGAACNHSQSNRETLVNLMCDSKAAGSGSYSYRGKWMMLDQLMVSVSLLKKKSGIQALSGSGKVYSGGPLLIENPKAGGLIPYKTYAGDKYLGGISDHLPVYAKFKPGKQ